MHRAGKSHDVALADGRTLRVRLWPGTGPPLVLLHGLFDSSEGWDDLARAVGRPCVAVDLPGFGRSDCPARPTLAAYAADVAEALDELRLEAFALVGHSLGGAVAAALAERTPQSVRSLVLCAPVGFGPIRMAEVVALPPVSALGARALPVLLANPLLVTAVYATFVTNRCLPAAPLLGRLIARPMGAVPGALAAVSAIAEAGRSPGAFAEHGVAYRGPVAALWGARDAVVPLAHIRALKRSYPQARLEVWDGMGHHPQRERADRLAGFIERAAAPLVGTRRPTPAAERPRSRCARELDRQQLLETGRRGPARRAGSGTPSALDAAPQGQQRQSEKERPDGGTGERVPGSGRRRAKSFLARRKVAARSRQVVEPA
ncbi:MAG: alpha/beta fold hydrolase [Solirubrobacteraceae bacterium]